MSMRFLYASFPILLSLLTIFVGCQPSHTNRGADKETLKITGSTTVGPLVQKAAEAYEKIQDTYQITISEGGSGVGIANLLDGNTDIAMSSRAMKMSEVLRFEGELQEVEEVILAYDALAVVVHPNNVVKQLTKAQLAGIYSGEIENWKAISGVDLPIVPISRESSSGTFEFFKNAVLDNKEITSKSRSQGSNGGIEQMVSQTEGGIGFIGLAFMSERIKPIDLSFEEDQFVAPNLENAKQSIYPLARPLYLYYLKEKESKVKEFIQYLLSKDGQHFATEAGYVPVL